MEQADTLFCDVDNYSAVLRSGSNTSRIYRDLPLSDDGSNIRLLEILPGIGDEEIRCRLVVRQLSGTTHFEALSYTWGRLEEVGSIAVNGHTLTVTGNLEGALRHLRRPTKRRRLWVDAACIDQTNLRERGVQVMHMGQIYRHAEQVLVWLGPAGKHTSLALRYVRWAASKRKSMTFESRIGSCCPLHWRRSEERDELEGFACPGCGEVCWCDECVRTRQGIRSGLTDLIQREWWKRLWVVQEVAMAAGDPLVGCGSSWIAWSELVRYERAGNHWPGARETIIHLHEIRLDIKKPPRLRDSMEPLPYSSDAAAADDVFHWLQRTASLHCRDPRDKVYALLGMSRNKRWREFRPDYSISAGNLLSELVSQMITMDKNLDILTLCRPELHDGSSDTQLNVPPSWLPSFGVEGLPYLAMMSTLDQRSPLRALLDDIIRSTDENPVAIEKTDANSKAEARRVASAAEGDVNVTRPADSRPVLRVSGTILDVVVGVSSRHWPVLDFDMSDDPRLHDQAFQALYYWAPVWMALDPARMRIGDGIGPAALMSHLSEYFHLRRAVEECRGSSEEEALLRRQVAECEKDIKLKERVTAIDSALSGRKYFVTRQGLLGIGPESMVDGDSVVLLNGSSAAYALRSSPAGEPRGHRLVGNVFVNLPRDVYPWPKPHPPVGHWHAAYSQAALFNIW